MWQKEELDGVLRYLLALFSALFSQKGPCILHGRIDHTCPILPFVYHCDVFDSARSLMLQRRNTISQASQALERDHSFPTSLWTIFFFTLLKYYTETQSDLL